LHDNSLAVISRDHYGHKIATAPDNKKVDVKKAEPDDAPLKRKVKDKELDRRKIKRKHERSASSLEKSASVTAEKIKGKEEKVKVIVDNDRPRKVRQHKLESESGEESEQSVDPDPKHWDRICLRDLIFSRRINVPSLEGKPANACKFGKECTLLHWNSIKKWDANRIYDAIKGIPRVRQDDLAAVKKNLFAKNGNADPKSGSETK
jgi:hypothetical protein